MNRLPYYCTTCRSVIWTIFRPSRKRPIWTYCSNCKKQCEHELTLEDIHPACLRICGRIKLCSIPNLSNHPIRDCKRMVISEIP